MLKESNQNQLSLFPASFAAGSPVKMFRLPEIGRDWLEENPIYSLNLRELFLKSNRVGLSLKMFPDYSQAMKGKISQRSFEGWGNAGIYKRGAFLILNISGFPNIGPVCSLSEVLETDVARKYFLTQKTSRGIIRRAKKRGRALPKHLETKLKALAAEG